MRGRDAVLTGTAPDVAGAEQAVEAVAGVWGVRTVEDDVTKP